MSDYSRGCNSIIIFESVCINCWVSIFVWSKFITVLFNHQGIWIRLYQRILTLIVSLEFNLGGFYGISSEFILEFSKCDFICIPKGLIFLGCICINIFIWWTWRICIEFGHWVVTRTRLPPNINYELDCFWHLWCIVSRSVIHNIHIP